MKGVCRAVGELVEEGRFGGRRGKCHRMVMEETSDKWGAVCQVDKQETHAKKK